MRVVVHLDGRESEGGSGLLCHNERLSDPLNPFAQSLAELSSKRKKTTADHLEIGRREFMGGLYTNGNGPCIPSMNVLRCIEEGAKRHRRGKDVIRGMFPLAEETDLLYDGPRDPDELWAEYQTTKDKWALRKGVVVSGRRIIRTRPLFRDWQLDVPFQVDAEVLNLEDVTKIVLEAGIYEGLGDMRPIYGRFSGTVLTDEEWLRQPDGDLSSVWAANRASIERVLAQDAKRKEANEPRKKK